MGWMSTSFSKNGCGDGKGDLRVGGHDSALGHGEFLILASHRPGVRAWKEMMVAPTLNQFMLTHFS